MKLATARNNVRAAAGFTLAEVLAAMMFLALVIPAAVEALHVAGLAGAVAVRKSAAARVADRVLNESLVTTNWTSGMRSGTIEEGPLEFRWTVTSQNWPQDAMQLLTAKVEFLAQNKDYWVTMSTLGNAQPPATTSTGTHP